MRSNSDNNPATSPEVQAEIVARQVTIREWHAAKFPNGIKDNDPLVSYDETKVQPPKESAAEIRQMNIAKRITEIRAKDKLGSHRTHLSEEFLKTRLRNLLRRGTDEHLAAPLLEDITSLTPAVAVRSHELVQELNKLGWQQGSSIGDEPPFFIKADKNSRQNLTDFKFAMLKAEGELIDKQTAANRSFK